MLILGQSISPLKNEKGNLISDDTQIFFICIFVGWCGKQANSIYRPRKLLWNYIKKDNRPNTQNDRPVIPTSIVSKIMEYILNYYILPPINNFDLLNIGQHGFIEKRSCLTNINEYLKTYQLQ